MSDLHLTYCCPACQRVKDQPGEGLVDQDWCTMADYVKRYPIPGQDVLLSEFYCIDCSASGSSSIAARPSPASFSNDGEGQPRAFGRLTSPQEE